MTERKTAQDTARAKAVANSAVAGAEVAKEQVSALHVSALMDNELSRRECAAAVAGLAEDPSLRATWQRYHLVRTALRREPHYPVATDLAARIAARLDESGAPDRRRVGVLHWPVRRHPRFAGVYKGAAGLALAASVAAVAIVGVRTLAPVTMPGTAPSAALPQAAVAPARDSATEPLSVGTSLAAAPKTSRRGIHWETAQPDLENNLNAFLVQHSQFTRTSGMGVMSYVRIAGYDTHPDRGHE